MLSFTNDVRISTFVGMSLSSTSILIWYVQCHSSIFPTIVHEIFPTSLLKIGLANCDTFIIFLALL